MVSIIVIITKIIGYQNSTFSNERFANVATSLPCLKGVKLLGKIPCWVDVSNLQALPKQLDDFEHMGC